MIRAKPLCFTCVLNDRAPLLHIVRSHSLLIIDDDVEVFTFSKYTLNSEIRDNQERLVLEYDLMNYFQF